jgi:hypothetical protein
MRQRLQARFPSVAGRRRQQQQQPGGGSRRWFRCPPVEAGPHAELGQRCADAHVWSLAGVPVASHRVAIYAGEYAQAVAASKVGGLDFVRLAAPIGADPSAALGNGQCCWARLTELQPAGARASWVGQQIEAVERLPGGGHGWWQALGGDLRLQTAAEGDSGSAVAIVAARAFEYFQATPCAHDAGRQHPQTTLQLPDGLGFVPRRSGAVRVIDVSPMAQPWTPLLCLRPAGVPASCGASIGAPASRTIAFGEAVCVYQQCGVPADSPASAHRADGHHHTHPPTRSLVQGQSQQHECIMRVRVAADEWLSLDLERCPATATATATVAAPPPPPPPVDPHWAAVDLRLELARQPQLLSRLKQLLHWPAALEARVHQRMLALRALRQAKAELQRLLLHHPSDSLALQRLLEAGADPRVASCVQQLEPSSAQGSGPQPPLQLGDAQKLIRHGLRRAEVS